MKSRKKPIEVFGNWVQSGKDEGMETNHREAVENMLGFALPSDQPFTFIDAGCGNGWVVREVLQLPLCKSATGVDGAAPMIAKAQKKDPKGTYFHADLLSWVPKNKVDVVHSMEVCYYFENPILLLKHIYTHWLASGARLIMGMDYYMENTVSHSWPEDCGVSIMTLLSEKQWLQLFKQAGFVDIQHWRVGPKENWTGTLVVTGRR
ncbi:MAG: class I SAM-dependent methyltransferase [Flavobacteriaceae bacterium]